MDKKQTNTWCIQTFNAGVEVATANFYGWTQIESFGLLESLVAPFISRKDTNMRRCQYSSGRTFSSNTIYAF